MHTFLPIVINALYTGIDRGLASDILAARALEGRALAVCTSIVVASHGQVTDVLDVPTDTIDAQLEHLLATSTPNAAKISIVGSSKNVEVIFKRLQQHLQGPILLDITLSGPSGEDIMGPKTLDALRPRLPEAGLVTIRQQDAALLAAMEIRSLDDAQVAVQRLHKLGARRVLLRCGDLPARFFEVDGTEPDGQDPSTSPFMADLYYDGEEFNLFEAPRFDGPHLHGASSALNMAILRELTANKPVVEALQTAKAYVTQALRAAHQAGLMDAPSYHVGTTQDL
ncbi:MAG: bifunctional hydroxymethylpyrimidine kinase/phosphomethylpyrimidine kinase [Bacteroidota bacterium]